MNKSIFAFAVLLGLAAAGPAVADKHGRTDGGLYFSGHALLTNPRAVNQTSAGSDRWSFDLGYGATGAVGYTFAYPQYAGDFRVEFEGSYRSVPFDNRIDADGTFHDLGGDFVFAVGMVNLLVDFHTQTRVTPYVGVGAGWGYILWDDYTDNGFLVGDIDWYRSMWQFMGGIGYRLSPGLIVDFEYRYFQPNDSGFDGYTSNEGSMGLRIVF